VSRLTATLQGPGGAFITSSRGSKSEEMSISFQINQPEIRLSKLTSVEVRYALGRYIRDLQSAERWLAFVAADPVGLKRTLAAAEVAHGAIDQAVATEIQKLYDDRLLREIDNRLFRTMQAPPAEIPIAFSKEKLIETISEARRWARQLGADPVNRFMLAVQHADLVWDIFPDAKPDEDLAQTLVGDEVRMPQHTPTGGSYGRMMGLKVIVDPEMTDKWELRDGRTGDKIRFVENPDEPGKRYYFNFNPGEAAEINNWLKGGVNDGS
jgi:hypothetical protein